MSSRRLPPLHGVAAETIESSYRLEATRVVASAIGLLYLALGFVLGALAHTWKGWALVVAVLVVFAIIGALSIAHLSVRAVREREALRQKARTTRGPTRGGIRV